MDKKFLEKNVENINKLNTFIDDNNKAIACLIVSPETGVALQLYSDSEVLDGELLRYKGIRVLQDNYQPSTHVRYVMKENHVKFDVPCLCGFYKGEGHNYNLR